MKTQLSLTNQEILRLESIDGGPYLGGNQEWYPTRWQRDAGCGPTTCANLLWYMAHTQTGAQGLAPAGHSREAFTGLMQEVWQYVKPGLMGVYSPKIFCRGAVAYGKSKGIPVGCDMLAIGKRGNTTPLEMELFLLHALRAGRPVAFLNLAAGALQRPESWHWVTLTGYSSETGLATVLDNGTGYTADMRLWMRTTRMGGGMAALYLE